MIGFRRLAWMPWDGWAKLVRKLVGSANLREWLDYPPETVRCVCIDVTPDETGQAELLAEFVHDPCGFAYQLLTADGPYLFMPFQSVDFARLGATVADGEPWEVVPEAGPLGREQ